MPNPTSAVIYPSYIMMPLFMLLAILPWASFFKAPYARVFLLPMTGVLMMGGIAEGLYQASMSKETPREKVVSVISALVHIVPFVLMAMLYRPQGNLRWNGALIGGVYLAILFIIVMGLAYIAADAYPYNMDMHTAFYSTLSGMLLGILVGVTSHGTTM